MVYEKNVAKRFYKALLKLYPRAFQERLGESMEQTFNDLYQERQTRTGSFGFVLWMFLETAMGIFREHLLLITKGDSMRLILTNLSSSGLLSLLLILPFAIMEVVNRRNLNEEFPFMLFFGMWLNLLAISLILLPIVLGRRTANHDPENTIPTPANTLLTNPRSAAIISLVIILSIVILSLLNAIGWEPLGRLLNVPNPEQLYVFSVRVPSQFIAFVLFSLPVAAGIIAGRPIVSTMRAGGRLFAHPIHLIIVVLLVSGFAFGLVSLVIDQWPCFLGVPNCD